MQDYDEDFLPQNERALAGFDPSASRCSDYPRLGLLDVSAHAAAHGHNLVAP